MPTREGTQAFPAGLVCQSRPVRSGRQVVAVGAVLACLLLALALLASASGPATVGDLRTGGLVDGPLLPAPEELAERGSEVEQPEEQGLPRWLPVLVLLGVSMLLAVLVRLFRRTDDDVVRRRDDRDHPTGDAAGDPDDLVLDEVRRVLERAADELARVPGGAADAVVTCWERLEGVGEAAGTPRADHETPTEYAADLLRRHGADEAAVAELVRLYHRARFGRGDLPEGAGARAAAALERVVGTLGTGPVRAAEGG